EDTDDDHRFDEISILKAEFQGSVEGYFGFFDDLFPYLLHQAYRILKMHYPLLAVQFPTSMRLEVPRSTSYE
ncbi:hypothetical protein MKW98_013103, partial [Papaver atlanticum]